jgi:alpha-mannosidase
MIGNAHIDPVWLWPWQAGADEVLATFSSAVARCTEYPQFIFTRGEAWAYEQVRRLDPDLFAQVRELVGQGRWHITGGQWIQPDVNLPTLGGLRRQLLHGRRYFQQHFGVTPDVGYNVDSFGHPATLPDLLAAEGYLGYVFHRPQAHQVKLPAATFRWRGVKGGEVLAFRIPGAYTTRADDLYGQIMLALDAADRSLGHVMCFYGVGNHGGGPTKGNIEYILEHQHDFPDAELRFSTPQAFFQAVNAKRDQLPVVELELQRTFPGCYVVMQDIKRAQRHNECLLEQVEHAIDRLVPPDRQAPMRRHLDLAWNDLLFTEFHDILAGTSIHPAWDSVRAMQGRARIVGEELLFNATRSYARRHMPRINHQQIAIINPGPEDFDGYIEHEAFLDFDAWNKRWLADEQGRPVPFQLVQPQSTVMLTPALVFHATAPAGGAVTLVLRDDPPPPGTPTVANTLAVSECRLSNDLIEARLCQTGIAQLIASGESLLGPDGLGLRLREDRADTWGFHIDRFAGPITDALDSLTWIVQETGPLRGRVRAQVLFGRTSVDWTLTIHAGQPWIDMRLDVVSAERFRLLQMPIQLPHSPTGWRCGLAGGAIDRAPEPVEWPLQGWAYPTMTGASVVLTLLTQDINSASLDGNRWTWSLMRATRMAWSGQDVAMFCGREDFTDQGTLRFDLRLMVQPVWALSDARLAAHARSMATRPVVFDRYEGMNRPPWGNNTPRRLWTPSEHRARKDGRMGHLQETGPGGVEER